MARSSALFTKRNPDAHPDFYAAEAAGLRWLGAAGAPVVDVIDVAQDHIDLERLMSGRADPAAANALGRALATMHDAGVDGGFGCPPDGFAGQIFIGRRPMSSTQHSRWGEFYAAERVVGFVRIAVDEGSVSTEQLGDIERACGAVADGTFDDDAAPARIHGDLWNGNVVWTPRGAVLIDPAAHGGHRETDLAMLALFGCPFLPDVIAGYCDVHPLRSGWRERVPLHQLHPLAVHAAGYGPGYGRQLHSAAGEVLRLL
ncbi:fructosamine kinase family protein [Antrihabitans spumae]|uniref:Fructosamine kinase family protein n=1 Tax=Antrihabitans spumae TaxID=3373370 RepID=A0ABW7KRH1_9NOCA